MVAAPVLARRLARYDIDGVIAEGTESGGHVGETTTMALVPQVVDAVDVPVIAAGGIADGVELRDLVLAMGACTDSNFAHQYRLPGTFAPTASFELLEKAVQTAREKNLRYRVGNVVTSDIFYGDCENETAEWKKMGVLAVEMETAALYMTAARAGKQALSITTVSDLPLKGESTSSEERQKTFTQMMEVALAVASEAVDGHDK